MTEKTSGMAIASLILGVLAMLLGWIPVLRWLIILVGLGLGIAALMKISKDENLKGKGLAIAGIVLSCLALFFFVILMGLGALAYFGAVEPDEFLPRKCTLPTGIACLDFMVFETGDAQIKIHDSMGFDLKNAQASLVTAGCTSQRVDIAEGSIVTFKFSNCNVGKKGSKIYDDLQISYTDPNTGMSHKVLGELICEVK